MYKHTSKDEYMCDTTLRASAHTLSEVLYVLVFNVQVCLYMCMLWAWYVHTDMYVRIHTCVHTHTHTPTYINLCMNVLLSRTADDAMYLHE